MKRLSQRQATRNEENGRAFSSTAGANLPPVRTFNVRTHDSTLIQNLDVTKVTYTEPPPPYPGLPSVQLPDPPSYDDLPGSTNGRLPEFARPPSENVLPLKR
ncbi:unnamed protein product [Toxocara canis]|nr:unnamed protein product [Toxocara canis]